MTNNENSDDEEEMDGGTIQENVDHIYKAM